MIVLKFRLNEICYIFQNNSKNWIKSQTCNCCKKLFQGTRVSSHFCETISRDRLNHKTN